MRYVFTRSQYAVLVWAAPSLEDHVADVEVPVDDKHNYPGIIKIERLAGGKVALTVTPRQAQYLRDAAVDWSDPYEVEAGHTSKAAARTLTKIIQMLDVKQANPKDSSLLPRPVFNALRRLSPLRDACKTVVTQYETPGLRRAVKMGLAERTYTDPNDPDLGSWRRTPAGDLAMAEWDHRFDKPRGQRQNPEPTSSAAFKRWFGDSKVVDAYGRPLVVYHGTPDVRGMLESGFRPSYHRGSVYFATDDYRTAVSYADDRRASDYQNAEPGVIPLYLSIQDPMVVDGKFQHWRGTEAVIEKARKAGHDGVIIHNVVDHHQSMRAAKPKRKDASTVYAFFRPTQAKSALTGPMRSQVDGASIASTGPNSGMFDPEDPSLMNPARAKRARNPKSY